MADKKETGLIQVYTGDGKGKSTAAFGLALRGLGCGLKVAIIQFMKKGEWYGETAALARLPEIELSSFGMDGFLIKGEPLPPAYIELVQAALEKTKNLLKAGEIDILILDELNNAIFFGLVTEAQTQELLMLKPAHMELVITGRNAPQYLLQAADLITEMREIKHPYRHGLAARRGIEY
ncbi:MAG: cob(I)yrinic acid a,c-diamide adenosyltransferase [Firmicutes bacterium]|nr:cob(I)yrinic acid a,c-diamide adenosyltransferase [Bacillota bacterium]